MNKPPAFQFYPSDFLSDENVVLMNNQEVGCYIKLLCFCWKQGSIPNRISKIAKLCGEDEKTMAQLWESIKPCFRKNGEGDRYSNPRLEKERQKQIEFRQERSKSGKKGAISRWSNKENKHYGSAITKPMAKPMAKNGSSSSSSSSSPTTKKNIYDQNLFGRFWDSYPKKVGKQEAIKAFKKIKRPGSLINKMIETIERYKNSEQWNAENGQFIPNPATWLNRGQWEDELPETEDEKWKRLTGDKP